MRPPLVSVVMPAYNRLAWLRDAIDSVFAQTLRDWELIVADDGSDPPAREYLRALAAGAGSPVRVLWLRHSGNPPAAREAALREARARYVAFLDSDDVWLPGKLERQLASLGRHPAREWSYTRCLLVDADLGRPLAGRRELRYPAARQGWILESLLKGEAAVTQSSVLVLRESLARAGGYPQDLPICGDYDLYVRLAQRSEIDFIDEPLVLVRRHGEHYCDDVAALAELRRFIRKLQLAGMSPHHEAILRARRAGVSASLARAEAACGDRALAMRTLLSSAPYSWPYRSWWSGTLATVARTLVPRGLYATLRGSAVAGGKR